MASSIGIVLSVWLLSINITKTLFSILSCLENSVARHPQSDFLSREVSTSEYSAKIPLSVRLGKLCDCLGLNFLLCIEYKIIQIYLAYK